MSAEFVRAVHDLCVGATGGYKAEPYFLGFMLRGLGCPDADARLTELRGEGPK